MLSKYTPLLALALGQGFVVNAAVPTGSVETGHQPELSLNYLLEHVTPPHKPQFRVPPSLLDPPSSPPTWGGTPGDWFLGTWYFFATNSPVYTASENMEWTLTPISQADNSAPSTQIQDLTTFYINGTEYLFYGIDTPMAPAFGDAYNYVPTGPLAIENNTWEVIAWGYDSAAVPYAVLYETPAYRSVPCLDFLSRDERGIAKDTYQSLKEGVKDLRNSALNSLLADVVKLVQNGGRNGQPYPTCNATCMLNAYAEL